MRGVRTGDRGRGRNGEPLPNFEPGSEIIARVTVLCEGTQGHLTGAAVKRFGLESDSPPVWALGVKEVWKVPRPLDRVIHTMGWPLRNNPRYREFGGSFIYPLGDDMVTIGMVVGLDYRDVELSVHDLLQELKTHPLVRRILEGGERIEWGAKTIPEGGFVALPRQLHAPGLLLCGDGAGLVNVPALKGVHYAVESGRLAAEAAFAAVRRGASPATALGSYDDALRESFIWSDLREVRNMRQAFGHGFWLGGALAGAMTVTKGRFPPGNRADRARRRAVADPHAAFAALPASRRQGSPSTSSRPSTRRATRRATTSRTTSACRRACPSRSGACGSRCALRRSTSTSRERCSVTPSNCVQCGAISAKGGRLTPPEGGSGPEYKLS